MVRYLGPHLKITRKLGNLKGFTNKNVNKYKKKNDRKKYIRFTKRISKYAIRLKEKQRLRFNYGISEKQLFNYVKKLRNKKFSSEKSLLTELEMRLDNIVYQLGLAPTVRASRQLINHGHICVNNRVVDIPNFKCRKNMCIRSKNNLVSHNLFQKNLELNKNFHIPNYLYFNKKKLEGRIINLVRKKYVKLLINELLIIEFYSRKM